MNTASVNYIFCTASYKRRLPPHRIVGVNRSRNPARAASFVFLLYIGGELFHARIGITLSPIAEYAT